jgi:UDP-N-acetylmuramate-alanine ligase
MVGESGAVGKIWVWPSGAVEPHKINAVIKAVRNRIERSRVEVTAVHWSGTFTRTVKSQLMKS